MERSEALSALRLADLNRLREIAQRCRRWPASEGDFTIAAELERIALAFELANGKVAEPAAADTISSRLIHAQRLGALGTCTGHIAHDLNNTLTPVVALSKLLLAETQEDDPRRATLDLIHRAGLQARSLVGRVLAYLRKEDRDCDALDLAALVTDALPLLRALLPPGVQLYDRLAPVPVIRADPTQLNQVLLNLVKNAADALGEGPGEIVIEVAAAEDGQSPLVPAIRLQVSDTGGGMDEATRRRACEPFFTTKPADRGTGLGLSVVRAIVAAHRGSLAIDSEPGAGTRVDIRLPADRPVPPRVTDHIEDRTP